MENVQKKKEAMTPGEKQELKNRIDTMGALNDRDAIWEIGEVLKQVIDSL